MSLLTDVAAKLEAGESLEGKDPAGHHRVDRLECHANTTALDDVRYGFGLLDRYLDF